VVSIDELRLYGYDDQAVRRHVRDGYLHPLYRAVYAVGHDNLTNEGRWLAAVKACGEGAVLAGYAAGALFRIVKWDERLVEVMVTRHIRPVGIVIRRTSHLPITDTTRRRGIPVTTPERTLRDLASILPYDQLRRAVREAQALRLTTVGRLAAQLDAPGPRRGRANLAKILAAGPAPTRSEPEDVVLDLLLHAGFDPPDVNSRSRPTAARWSPTSAGPTGSSSWRPTARPGTITGWPATTPSARRCSRPTASG
jgi:hypothetical protein